MENNKIEKMAEVAMNVLLDEIREHRRKAGLDPVWYPSEEWLTEKYQLFLTYFKSI